MKKIIVVLSVLGIAFAVGRRKGGPGRPTAPGALSLSEPINIQSGQEILQVSQVAPSQRIDFDLNPQLANPTGASSVLAKNLNKQQAQAALLSLQKQLKNLRVRYSDPLTSAIHALQKRNSAIRTNPGDNAANALAANNAEIARLETELERVRVELLRPVYAAVEEARQVNIAAGKR